MENSSLGKRAGGAIFALGMQAVLIALFLFSMPRPIPPQVAREMLLSLLPRRVEKPPAVINGRGASRRAIRPTAQTPAFTVVTPSSIAPAPFASPSSGFQLGAGLTGCTQERLDTLSAEERIRCGFGFRPSPSHEGLSPPVTAKDQEHWEADMARKNTPLQVPCTYTTADGPSGAAAVMVSLPCVAGLLFGASPPPPPKVHASDAAFQSALAAANQRRGGKP